MQESEIKKALKANAVRAFTFYRAQDWIRTSTSLRTLRPEHSASTNFATWAAFPSLKGFRAANIRDYPETLKSLNASFKLVFKSVLALRCPIINAQPTPYSPAGNFLL